MLNAESRSFARGDVTRTNELGLVSLPGAYTATEESGAEVGEYRRETAWRRNGSVTWYGREYEMVQTNAWRSLFALRRAERDLLTLKAYSMGPRRVSCRVTGAEAVEPGLELFCAWLVWRFAQEDASTAAASSG